MTKQNIQDGLVWETYSEGVSTGQFWTICSQNYNNDRGTERKI